MTDREPIRRFADRLEHYLEELGADLTTGGEPTFVSRCPDSPEWHTEAVGPEKLGYARRMAARLLADTYPGALVMQVFGKRYPGEALPRWNLLVLSAPERDLWPDSGRLLLEDRAGGNGAEAVDALAAGLAEALAVEHAPLPVAESDAPASPVGRVLPLDRESGRWVSDSWPTNEHGCVELVPGDSPAGLRLPLTDLPPDAMRRALTVELDRGALAVFLPPLDLEGFEALLAVLADRLWALGLEEVVFCGYPPAEAAAAYTVYGIAADPGVLEVNLPACSSWADYDRILSRTHAVASAEDLRLTKLHLNGAVRGTGGGSHLTFGGPDPARNPFLHEPGRIASLLRYWQHHPSLSFLFSGQFVGPGCQAPRIDEGPLHGLYELEVACEGLERQAGPVDDLSVDRFLRHLATDSAGNTHRAEICFDKFGNPAAPNGRLGIIELRAFETFGAIESMSTTALFIRTILAYLFRKPFREPLRRFGPALHDRYFLPEYLWSDVRSICDDLATEGLPFEADWLRDVLEFRCPVVGTLATPAGKLEVRQALESWPLLAEESAGATTVRMVDNSTDRLQVALPASKDPPGMLVANGLRIPLRRVRDRLVAGIRYKCASASPALHPHVDVQSPLNLEWIDGTGKVVAAADYHYWNPEAPSYPDRPADVDEARRRREARWQVREERIGRKPDPIDPRSSPEFEITVDLRRNERPDRDSGG
ncbi:MAG: transglutaminase family protein [Xanthomonadales bacterium]|nr:transglutaminase family protein [Xanthomonadales bacterium]